MKKLPIGISNISEIREYNYIYIDKTKHVANLVNSGKYYFLSRPRRFGKSLLVDTLKQAFLGNKVPFTGLYLESNWDWNIVYPVIHLDFGNGVIRLSQELDNLINSMLDKYYRDYNIENIYVQGVNIRFSYLIGELAKKYQQKVVVLIDEYDKPILDNITNLDVAIETREGLKNLYSVIKAQDANLKFVLLTGVSKFSKVSLFSGLNNLHDITLSQDYADICGYTQAELEGEFVEYLSYGNVDLARLKHWYNGYNFAGTLEQSVYNPFDILLFCSNNYQYRNYWFETATPTFLVKILEKYKYFIPDLENAQISDKLLLSFDIDKIDVLTLLFQTGYLTIKEITTLGTQYAYILTYPNLEVKASLTDSLADIGSNQSSKTHNISRLDKFLKENNIAGLEQVFTSYFASIPHDWYRNNNMANYEGFYASIVYCYFCALGYDTIAEDTTNHGKIDMTIKMPDKILIVEFKLSKYGSAMDAINQIKEREYPHKYTGDSKPIYLIGASFDTDNKNIVDFVWELV